MDKTTFSGSPAEIEAEFRRLAAAWKEETSIHSSFFKLEENQHYQDIIALGKPVVPVILRELQQNPQWYFTALRQITGQNPVPDEDRGYLLKMRDHWLSWGRKNGYEQDS